MEHETGLEPATPTLATCIESPKTLRNPAREPQGAAPSRSCVPIWARGGHATIPPSQWWKSRPAADAAPSGLWDGRTREGPMLDPGIRF
jgi:hypothetical protein